MVGWHHQYDGHEFEQAPVVGDGYGSLVCCSPWGCKELDTTKPLTRTKFYPWAWELFHPHLISVQDLVLSFCLLLTHTSIHNKEIFNFHSDLGWTFHLLPLLPHWTINLCSWKPTPPHAYSRKPKSNNHGASYLFTLTSNFSSMVNSHSRHLYVFSSFMFPVPHFHCAEICPYFPPGYSPWGHKESDTTEQLHFHCTINNYLEGSYAHH